MGRLDAEPCWHLFLSAKVLPKSIDHVVGG
jgi:hypothetical protein